MCYKYCKTTGKTDVLARVKSTPAAGVNMVGIPVRDISISPQGLFWYGLVEATVDIGGVQC